MTDLLARFIYPKTYAALDKVDAILTDIREALRRNPDPQIAADLDEIAAGHPSRFPEPGDELLLSEIPCSTYIRMWGEDVIFLGHRGDVMDGIDATGNSFQYHATEGERFRFVSDLI